MAEAAEPKKRPTDVVWDEQVWEELSTSESAKMMEILRGLRARQWSLHKRLATLEHIFGVERRSSEEHSS